MVDTEAFEMDEQQLSVREVGAHSLAGSQQESCASGANRVHSSVGNLRSHRSP